MRCKLCGDDATWWRRQCADCRRLWRVWREHRMAGMRALLQAFADTDIAPDKINRFLEAEPNRGGGSIRDLIAADMTNQLLGALGERTQQTGTAVKRLRERGLWRALDQRPRE